MTASMALSFATCAAASGVDCRFTPMRTLLLTALLPIALTHASGQTFTAHIRAADGAKGRVVVTQSARIEALVDGTLRENRAETPEKPAAPVSTPKNDAATPRAESAEAAREARAAGGYAVGARQRYKAKGFRIQVFTGGNSRTDKDNAARAGQKIKTTFPELSVYTHFLSPRWVCRVGDFHSREDAEKYAAQIRRSGITQECHIVACTVLLAR